MVFQWSTNKYPWFAEEKPQFNALNIFTILWPTFLGLCERKKKKKSWLKKHYASRILEQKKFEIAKKMPFHWSLLLSWIVTISKKKMVRWFWSSQKTMKKQWRKRNICCNLKSLLHVTSMSWSPSSVKYVIRRSISNWYFQKIAAYLYLPTCIKPFRLTNIIAVLLP